MPEGIDNSFNRTSPYPTEAEASSLPALSPGDPASDPTISEVLHEVFRICQSQWVVDFLFNTDMTPLSALTAPVNMKSAISSTFQLTSLEQLNPETPQSEGSGLFDFQMVGDIIFVPAFSVSPITVGFGVQQNSTLCRSEWGCEVTLPRLRELGHFRYARDDDADILFVLFDDVLGDILKLDVVRLVSPKIRKRSYISLRRSTFREALSQKISPNLSSLAKCCILICISSDDIRQCPMCKSTTADPCECTFSKTRPSHPYDFSITYKNMIKHVGAFEGISTVHYCINGMPVMSTKLGNRLSIDPSHEFDLITRLSRWAIKDKLETMKEDPLKSVIPYVRPLIGGLDNLDGDSAASKKGSTTAFAPSATSHDASQNRSQPNDSGLQRPPILDSLNSISDLGGSNLTTNDKHTQYGHMDSHENHYSNEMLSDRGKESTLFEDGGLRVWKYTEGEDALGGPTAGSSGTRNDPDLALMDRIASEARAAYSFEIGAPSAANQEKDTKRNELDAIRISEYGLGDDIQEEEEDVISDSDKELVTRMSTEAISDKTIVGRKRERTRVADERNAERLNQGGNVNPSRAEIERERRAELRRQRNREAAQRSNLRRKIKNDTLKRELSETHARATALRAQELALREENLRLRKKLSSL